MDDIGQPTRPQFVYITDNDEARKRLADLEPEMVVGLDTETYWNTAANKSNVSLVQVAPREGQVLVFDLFTVDVEILRSLIESPSITMVAHNARFDEAMLIGEGLKPQSFVDTLRLARSALRLPSYSLAAVTAHLFGIALDKSFQKSNWRRRPLTRAQLEYAALDAMITLRVYDELCRNLTEQGKLEAAISAASLRPQTDAERAATPRRRRAPQPPPRPLTGEERRAIAYLKKWRMAKAFEGNIPVYMVCADKTLEHLAMERPAELEALNAIHGLGASKISRYGAELLEELRKAFS